LFIVNYGDCGERSLILHMKARSNE